MKLKYIVIGTGAYGGVLGCKLLSANCDVSFLAKHNDPLLQCNEMKISDQTMTANQFTDLSVKDSITKMPKCDVVLLAIKSYDNTSILPDLKAILKPESIIIIFQNGLTIEKVIAKLYPDIQQIVTVSWLKATKLSSGNYRHDFGNLIDGIAYLGQNDSYRFEPNRLEKQIMQDFTCAGLNLQFTQHFFEKQWTKLALNIPIFSITIKYNISSKTALSDEVYSAEIVLVRNEIKQVAKAYSITIDTAFISQVDEQLKNSKNHTYPSMKVDYDNKKKLELDTIFLPVIEMANAKKVNVSHLMTDYELLQKLASNYDKIE